MTPRLAAYLAVLTVSAVLVAGFTWAALEYFQASRATVFWAGICVGPLVTSPISVVLGIKR